MSMTWAARREIDLLRNDRKQLRKRLKRILELSEPGSVVYNIVWYGLEDMKECDVSLGMQAQQVP